MILDPAKNLPGLRIPFGWEPTLAQIDSGLANDVVFEVFSKAPGGQPEGALASVKPVTFAQVDTIQPPFLQPAGREKLQQLIGELEIDRGVEDKLAPGLPDAGIPGRGLRRAAGYDNQ